MQEMRKHEPVTKSDRWRSNQRGFAMIMVTLAIVACFAFVVLGVETAILMTQLHAAADAAALAGASGMLEGSETTAIQRAIYFAGQHNAVENGMQPVIITAEDISFPEPDKIRVRTHRTVATGDPIRLFFMRVIDPSSNNTGEMTAVAAARFYDVCASKCLKPWSVPDRWDDANANGVYDEGEYYDPNGTGYLAPLDVGAAIVLKVSNPNQAIEPGIFYPVDFPPLDNEAGDNPLTGGSWYESWISGCEPYPVGVGDRLQLEPGNMVGPTIHGMEDLVASDPNAYWDPVEHTIKNSNFALSPRIGLIPFFDPTLPPTSGRNYVTVTKVAAFFMENVGPGSQVTGRFIQITTQGNPCPGGGNGDSFLKGIVLVE
jgi:Flp pilus assembly protein TadG